MTIVKLIIVYFVIRNFYLIFKKKKRVKKIYNDNNIVSLNLGSSHSELAFRDLSKVNKRHLNLAHASQTFYYDYILLKKFIKKQKVKVQKKTCFLSVSYFSLYAPKLWQKENIKNYYDYLDIADFENEYKIEVFIYKYLPIIYKNYEKLKNKVIGIKNKGNIEKRIRKHIKILEEQKYLDFNIENIKKIICLCEQNNIKLILFTTPFQVEYNKFFEKNMLEKNFYSIIENIAKRYRIDYFDFSKDYKNFDEKKYFEDYDYDHLSREGAKKFIKIFKAKVGE